MISDNCCVVKYSRSMSSNYLNEKTLNDVVIDANELIQFRMNLPEGLKEIYYTLADIWIGEIIPVVRKMTETKLNMLNVYGNYRQSLLNVYEMIDKEMGTQ